jgi:hypothetical protein
MGDQAEEIADLDDGLGEKNHQCALQEGKALNHRKGDRSDQQQQQHRQQHRDAEHRANCKP